MPRVTLIPTLLLAALPSLAPAAPFSWNTVGSPPIQFTSITSSPQPLTTDGRSLPFRFDVYSDAANIITDVQLSLGLPTGAASPGDFYLSFPLDGRIGSPSATYPTPIPLPPTGPFSADVTNPDTGHLTFAGNNNASTPVSSLSITLEKKIFGTWIPIPSLDVRGQTTAPFSFATPGDFYLNLQLLDATGATLFNTELYFSTTDGATAPFHYIAPTQAVVPLPAASLSILALLPLAALSRRGARVD